MTELEFSRLITCIRCLKACGPTWNNTSFTFRCYWVRPNAKLDTLRMQHAHFGTEFPFLVPHVMNAIPTNKWPKKVKSHFSFFSFYCDGPLSSIQCSHRTYHRPHLTMSSSAREQSVGAFAPNEFAHFLLRNNVCNLSRINIRIYIGQRPPISATQKYQIIGRINWARVARASTVGYSILIAKYENANIPMYIPICDAHYVFAFKSIEFLRQSNELNRQRASEQRKSKLRTHFVFILFDKTEIHFHFSPEVKNEFATYTSWCSPTEVQSV